MFSITNKLAEYLLTHAKDPQVPGLVDGENKPFVAKNTHSIGIIDPENTIGTNFDYIIHHDYDIQMGDEKVYTADVKGCWLYRKDELQPPTDPVTIERGKVDPYAKDLEEQFDVTDCCITFPSAVERISATRIESLEKLLEREPGINDCIDKTKQHKPWFSANA